MRDASDRVILHLTSTAGWLSRIDAYSAEVPDAGIGLAQLVGVVQANRELVRQTRAARRRVSAGS